MRKYIFCAVLILLLNVFLVPVFAQKPYRESQAVWRAKIVEIVREENRVLDGTQTQSVIQILRAEILEGEKRGEIVTLENDYLLLERGDELFLNYLGAEGGEDNYEVLEPDRRKPLGVFVLLFIAVVVFFGRWQGARALLALGGSFFIIFYLMLPKILEGFSPLGTSAVLSIFILSVSIYFTHGFNRKSHAAFLGTIATVVFIAFFSEFAVRISRLSGFTEDASVFLNIYTQGLLDMRGLLLAAIVIGVIGVLDDIAITQASVVEELIRANAGLPRKEVYRRALKVGRDHVGALINTLSLAYTGAALPLLLLFYVSETPVAMVLNREIIASELVRIIAGSTGVVLAVPFSTACAVFFLVPHKKDRTPHRLGARSIKE